MASMERNSHTSFKIKPDFHLLCRYEECKHDSPIAFFHCHLTEVDKLQVKKEVKTTVIKPHIYRATALGEHRRRNGPYSYRYMYHKCCSKHLPNCSL